MKLFLIALLTLGTFSAYAGSNDQTARLLGSTCNSRYGIGQVKIAVYDKKTKSLIINRLNVVNESLCSIGSGWGGTGTTSRLVDMSFMSMTGDLHSFRINSHNVVTDIQEVSADKGEMKKLYKKFNLLNLNNEEVDLRIVDLDLVFTDKDTIQRIPELINMAEMD